MRAQLLAKFTPLVILLGSAACGDQREYISHQNPTDERVDESDIVMRLKGQVVEAIGSVTQITEVSQRQRRSTFYSLNQVQLNLVGEAGPTTLEVEACNSSCNGQVPLTSIQGNIVVGSRVRAIGTLSRGMYSMARVETIALIATDATPPTPPTNLAATVSGFDVRLTWGPSSDGASGSGVNGYRVYRNNTLRTTLGPTLTSFLDTSVAPSSTLTYEVSAVDGAGNESTRSVAVSVTTGAPADTVAPSVPTGLVATSQSSSQIALSWDAAVDNSGGSGLKAYKVYREGAFVQEVAAAQNRIFADMGLAASATYRYQVSAVDNEGNESAKSTAASATTAATPDTTPPSVPTGLAGVAVGANGARLTWAVAADDAGGSGLNKYKVYRNSTFLADVPATATPTFNDTGLTAATAYTYRVSAVDNRMNESSQSTAVSVTTGAAPDATPPTTPTNVRAVAAGSTQINLTWTAATDTGGSGLAGYRIYRNNSAIATSTTASYSDTMRAPSTTYSYQITAYDDIGNESPKSGAVTATTDAAADVTPPTVPTGLRATVANDTQVNLSWSVSTDSGGSGLKGYIVFINGNEVATTANRAYAATGLAANTIHSFEVLAYDNADNRSAPTSAASGTTAQSGATLYAANCAGCHGALASSTKKGAGADRISGAIASQPSMAGLSSLSASAIAAIADALTPVRVFRIAAGTASGDWNTAGTIVTMATRQNLRIVNDDIITHELHTNGRPCGHGEAIPSGTSWDCVATSTYDAAVDGMIYDHLTNGRFYLRVSP